MAEDPAESKPAEKVEVPESAAPAPEESPVEASETKKPGFLARLVGAGAGAEPKAAADLEAEKKAHAATRDHLAETAARLKAAEGKIAEFEGLEAKAEERFNELSGKLRTAETAKEKAESDLATAKAELPGKIAAGVSDRMAALGVEEGDLPRQKAAPDKPGQGGEFAELKGRARAAAAFNAQFAGRN